MRHTAWLLLLLAASAALSPTEPLPRRHATLSPEELLTHLTSSDPSRLHTALNACDLATVLFAPITSATLAAAPLDSSPGLERILTIHTTGDTAVLIYQQDASGRWWNLSTFLTGGPTNQRQEPFLELRATVTPGIQDLILRQGCSQGTGVGQVELSIFRLWRAHLYNVLTLTESAHNWTRLESSRITFPKPGAPSPRLLVRTTIRTKGRTTTTRRTYQWHPTHFAFLPYPLDATNRP
jgi:hypothetical protein